MLDRAEDLATHHETPGGRKRNSLTIASGAAILIAVTATISYALASSHAVTRTVVRTVATPDTSATPSVDDRGFSKLDNGHQAQSNVFQQPVDPATQALLEHQLTLAREIAMKYPTVKDAEAAGWHRAGPFAPGLGAHYFHWSDIGQSLMSSGVIDDNTARHPAALIYDGTQSASRIAGLMYYSARMRIPEGFAGPNDIWHYHTNVCIVYGANGTIDTPYGADTTVTPAMCTAAHGSLMAKTQWMLHAWVVPGYDSPEGVFSHLNEAITCRDGTYNVIPLDKIGSRTSVCVDGGE